MTPESTAAAAAAVVAPGLVLLEGGACRNGSMVQVQYQLLICGIPCNGM
jgi:hypothetical protein